MRSMWSGAVRLAIFNLPVSVAKAVDDSESKGGLRRLCECHEQPFKRPADECPGGSHPESDAALKRGDPDLTPVVYGVEVTPPADDEPGEYRVVAEDELEHVADALERDGMEIDRVVPIDDVPQHLFEGLYYLQPDKKAKGSTGAFALFHRALQEGELAAVVEWQRRADIIDLVVIHPVGEVLAMNLLPYRAQVREPDEQVTGHAELDVTDKELGLMLSLLEQVTGEFEYGSHVDEAAELYEATVQKALAGKLPKAAAKKGAKPARKAPDLVSVLEASIEAAEGKPKKASKKRSRAKAAA